MGHFGFSLVGATFLAALLALNLLWSRTARPRPRAETAYIRAERAILRVTSERESRHGGIEH